MKTWFTTSTSHKGLETKLRELEELSHTIFEVIAVSGEIVIVSFTTA